MFDEKLQKVLATAGFGSRREMERAIEAGLVKVNGEVAKLGSRVKAGDKLLVDGQRYLVPSAAENRSDLRVILYNKPEGEICSRNDPEGRPTVYDRLPSLNAGRWISVGRLDFNTSGLLLFTNNGELANKLMHPSTGIDREYLVRVQGEVSNDQLQQLRDGVELEDGQAKFSDITLGGGKGTNCWYYCTVMEGRNREVRRLWESQGCRVSRLKRVRYGQILIPSYVRVGQWIEMPEADLALLCETAGIRAPAKKKFQRGDLEQYERRIKRLRSSPGKPLARSSRSSKTAAERAATIERPWLEKAAKKAVAAKPASGTVSANAVSGDETYKKPAAKTPSFATERQSESRARYKTQSESDTQNGKKSGGKTYDRPQGRSDAKESFFKPEKKTSSAGLKKTGRSPLAKSAAPQSRKPKPGGSGAKHQPRARQGRAED